MDSKEKIKKVLVHGSLDDYVENYYKKNFESIEEYLNQINSFDTLSHYDVNPAMVREEWDDYDNRENFFDDGYSEDDILYEDWAEASDHGMQEYIENIASDLIKKDFHNDMDFFKAVMKYLHSQRV